MTPEGKLQKFLDDLQRKYREDVVDYLHNMFAYLEARYFQEPLTPDYKLAICYYLTADPTRLRLHFDDLHNAICNVHTSPASTAEAPAVSL